MGKLHRDMRVAHWGYAASESLSHDDLLKVKYDGIRPAPGYPPQPDHTEKRTMWDLMDVEKRCGIKLSSSLSMMPAASVSALAFAHPELRPIDPPPPLRAALPVAPRLA